MSVKTMVIKGTTSQKFMFLYCQRVYDVLFLFDILRQLLLLDGQIATTFLKIFRNSASYPDSKFSNKLKKVVQFRSTHYHLCKWFSIYFQGFNFAIAPKYNAKEESFENFEAYIRILQKSRRVIAITVRSLTFKNI